MTAVSDLAVYLPLVVVQQNAAAQEVTFAEAMDMGMECVGIMDIMDVIGITVTIITMMVMPAAGTMGIRESIMMTMTGCDSEEEYYGGYHRGYYGGYRRGYHH